MNVMTIVAILFIAVIGYELLVINIVLKNIETAQREFIEQYLSRKPKPTAKTIHVTDPFVAANKRTTQKSSSDSIVIRKTPEQIRNENYEKIKKGQKYGFIDS